jgi:heat shock protein beta
MWQLLLLLGSAYAIEDIDLVEEAEQHEFQADVARVMDIFINSLYTNKEIFLRESISNASDALDKVRYLSLTDDTILGENDTLEIRIEYDEANRAVTISDTGIGMTKDDLIKHLGTVAKSGTTNFVEALASGGDINLIGQFGVGFYSNFLVSDKIIVTSKHNDDTQHVWVSQAGHSFKVFEDPRGDTLGRGTRLTLMLKSDSHDFADASKLKKIVSKYSEFVNYPIYMRIERDVTREVPWTQEELETLPQEETAKPNKITESVWEWELINENKPIWLREEVEDEEYNSFYKTLSKDSRDPMTHLHFNTEGEVEFTALLYIPSQAPYDLFQNYYGSKAPLKLYVRRVLITEEFEDILPRYLSFIRGVVDSNDMPLNVARESLQQKKILKLINKKIVRKVLQELLDMADEDADEYEAFYGQFGKNIKLGLMDDPTNKGKLSRLVRFYSTYNIDRLTSLDDYIERMKEVQEDIYFIAGDNRHKLAESPLIQKLVKLGYEVLLLDDPIDEYSINSLPEYEKHKIQNVAQDDWKLPEDDDLAQRKERKLKLMYKTSIDWMKGIIEERGHVSSIVVSTKLTDEPSIITTGEHGYSANMERLNKSQAFGSAARGGDHNRARRTWELNPAHPMIKKLKSYGELIPNDEDARESVETMLDLAMLNSGFIISEPTDMYRRIQKLVLSDLGVSEKDPIELPNVIVDMPEEEVDETTEL